MLVEKHVDKLPQGLTLVGFGWFFMLPISTFAWRKRMTMLGTIGRLACAGSHRNTFAPAGAYIVSHGYILPLKQKRDASNNSVKNRQPGRLQFVNTRESSLGFNIFFSFIIVYRKMLYRVLIPRLYGLGTPVGLENSFCENKFPEFGLAISIIKHYTKNS